MDGVWFGDNHSYRYYRMVLNQVVIGYPAVKTKYADKPSGNGTYDLTEFFGGTKYSDRTITFQFTIVGKWARTHEKITNNLHGKRMHITLDRMPDYYFVGRCSVDALETDRNICRLTISAVCEPFKYKKQETEYFALVHGTKNIILINDFMEVLPVIESDANFVLAMDGHNYQVRAGKQKLLDFKLVQGYNRVKITGEGNIRFTYREGAV